MVEQLTLDDPRARYGDPDTSHAAAITATVSRPRWATLVLAAHAAHPGGLIDDEVKVLLGTELGSPVTVRVALERAGLVVRTGERRVTRAGSPAAVYRITAEGLERAREDK